jgi:hypothetical protein
MPKADIQSLKERLDKITYELSANISVDFSDLKQTYSYTRRMEHLKREQNRLMILIELELANL